jgi:hypothetical protein
VIGVGLVYLGIVATLAGFLCLIKPLALPGVSTRRRAAALAGCGVLLSAAGVALPAGEKRVAAPASRLDEFVPVWQFHEVHAIRVRAPRQQVWQAIKSVTAGEIPFFLALTWLRRLGRPGPESILNAPEHRPLLEVATATTFLTLAEEPEREIVVGTLVVAPRGWRPAGQRSPEAFKALNGPGFALAAMNFAIGDCGAEGCLVTTETRVFATDAATRRRFAGYWRVIYPGSALIRRMWLGAIARRAATVAPR